MSRVVLDVEADNLFPLLTTIHVVCTLDIDSGETKSYRDVGTLLADARDWEMLIGHNVLGYDLFALWKLWNIPFTADSFNGQPMKIVDTLVQSRYLYPDRPWQHSLANWGEHLGIPKYEFHDFSQYSEEMRLYCQRDCEVTAEIYKALLKERAK